MKYLVIVFLLFLTTTAHAIDMSGKYKGTIPLTQVKELVGFDPAIVATSIQVNLRLTKDGSRYYAQGQKFKQVTQYRVRYYKQYSDNSGGVNCLASNTVTLTYKPNLLNRALALKQTVIVCENGAVVNVTYAGLIRYQPQA